MSNRPLRHGLRVTVTAQIMFSTPQHEVASLLRSELARCVTVRIVVGFATVEGVEALLLSAPGLYTKLAVLVVGASTFRGFDAIERLQNAGVDPANLMVHLGHTRLTRSAKAKHRFQRYHPMLHSKIYYFEHADGSASAFVGSHNMTGFALLGSNGEAGVLLQGPATDPEFTNVRDHIAIARQQSVRYDPSMRDALAWWSRQAMEGLLDRMRDQPRDGENRRTVVVLAEAPPGVTPRKQEVIYLELPKALSQVRNTGTEFHVFLFDSLPADPVAALALIPQARASLWCKTIGIEDDRGGKELTTNWEVLDTRPAVLRAAPRPFRPTPGLDAQQIRVAVAGPVRGRFEYLFGSGRDAWTPILSTEQVVRVAQSEGALLRSLDLVPAEDEPWFLVTGLVAEQHQDEKSEYVRAAMVKSSPEGGSFVLFSTRRRDLEMMDE